MFNFSVKPFQNGFASPATVAPPANGQPESPKNDVKIDTRPPFQSVKAAVSLFGEVNSPRARPVTKKTRAEEQKLLEKETQLHMVIKELDHYKEQLKLLEASNAQTQEDLQRTNITLQELTGKLENLSESKQLAIQSTDDYKRKAEELEEQKSLQAQGREAWKQELDLEQERYKVSSGDLIAGKQELANLRQDFDAALEAKLAAFQRIEDSRQAAKANQDKQNVLAKEVAMLRQALDKVKLDSMKAHEEHLKLIAEKEVHLLVHKSAKEVAENEIKSLKQQYGPHESIARKLEETTGAIKVIQEQLDDVRASDLNSLQTAITELDCAKKELQHILAEEASLRTTVDSLEQEVERVKRDRLELEKTTTEREESNERTKIEIMERKIELEEEKCRDIKAEMEEALQKVLEEVERERDEAEKLQKDGELLRLQAEASNIAAKQAEEKLLEALKMADQAKAAEKLADQQIRESNGGERKIRLTVEEFKNMNSKIEESRTNADTTVATLMAEIQRINANKNGLLQKVEEILREKEELEKEIEDAVRRAAIAEAARKLMEGELKKCRLAAGEPL